MHNNVLSTEMIEAAMNVAAFTLDPCMQLMLQLPQLTNLQFLIGAWY